MTEYLCMVCIDSCNHHEVTWKKGEITTDRRLCDGPPNDAHTTVIDEASDPQDHAAIADAPKNDQSTGERSQWNTTRGGTNDLCVDNWMHDARVNAQRQAYEDSLMSGNIVQRHREDLQRQHKQLQTIQTAQIAMENSKATFAKARIAFAEVGHRDQLQEDSYDHLETCYETMQTIAAGILNDYLNSSDLPDQEAHNSARIAANSPKTPTTHGGTRMGISLEHWTREIHYTPDFKEEILEELGGDLEPPRGQLIYTHSCTSKLVLFTYYTLCDLPARHQRQLFPISVLRYNALDGYDITTEEMLTQWARRRNDLAEECHGTQECQGKDEDAEPRSERPTSLDIQMLETEHRLNEFKVQLVTTRNIASAGPSQAELDLSLIHI